MIFGCSWDGKMDRTQIHVASNKQTISFLASRSDHFVFPAALVSSTPPCYLKVAYKEISDRQQQSSEHCHGGWEQWLRELWVDAKKCQKMTKATDNKYLGKNRKGKKGENISSEMENYDIWPDGCVQSNKAHVLDTGICNNERKTQKWQF